MKLTVKKIFISLLILITVLILADVFLLHLFFNRKNAGEFKNEPNSTLGQVSQEELNKVKGKAAPTSAATQSVKEKVISNIIRKERDSLILEENAQFTVSYFAPPMDVFYATILKKPYADNKKLAEKWFLDQGFAKSELCNLGLTFLADSVVFDPQERRAAESRAEGCPEIVVP